MFVSEKNFANAIQKVKVEVGTLVGLGEDKEAFIEMCEMPMLLTLKMKEEAQKGEVPLMEFFKDILPEIIVDHNFYENESKKWSNKELADFIYRKRDLCTKIVKEYSSASFFSRPPQSEGK